MNRPTPNLMDVALEEAELAAGRGEVPVGAVIANSSGKIIARGGNKTIELKDPTAHAEVLVIRTACQIVNNERLPELDLYVTLEPCTLCATAISFARIRRLYFGAPDPKGGAVEHGVRFFDQLTCHHAPEIYGGLGKERSAALLKDFFRARRK